MKHWYLLLPAALLLAIPRAHAQQAWQPFRPGLSYQLSETATPGDTTHVLRLGAGAPLAGTPDSLFRFNGRVGCVSLPSGSADCGAPQRLRADNLFGATLRSQPKSVFVLAAANGRTFTLRPRAVLGASWATGLPGLTASVTSRGSLPILGAVADSVAVLLLSDGETLRLSKQYGLLEGPSLDGYLNGRNRKRHLLLTALPERHLGTPVTGALAAYDYQPGDVFQYVTHSYLTQVAGLCQQAWRQDSVLTRQASRTGDTVTYTIRTRLKTQSFGSAAAPAGLCQAPSGTIVAPPYTSTLRVVGGQVGALGTALLTGYYPPVGPSVAGKISSVVSQSAARFGGRPEYAQLLRQSCPTSSPDSVALTGLVDLGGLWRYAAGLGQTYSHTWGIYNDDLTELTAFRKSSQSWGTFFAASTLLAARPERAVCFTSAFPNPFGSRLTAGFMLTQTQPVAATLTDALGRLVADVPAATLPAGAQQLAVPTAGLPAGVYALHLRFAADGRTEVLRVVKAE